MARLNLTADGDISTSQTIVTIDASSAAVEGNLPAADDAAGIKFNIIALDVTNEASLVTDDGSSIGTGLKYIFENEGEYIQIESNGKNYIIIGKGIRIPEVADAGTVNIGTANTGVTATTYGDGRNYVTKLDFTDLAIDSVTNANKAIGKLLYTLPAGVQIINAAYMTVALSGSGSAIDTDTPDVGVGTVIASGAVATLDGTATFENIITGQTANDVNGTAEVKTTIPTAGVPLVRESGDAKTIHLNMADGWAGSANVTATGTVTIYWTKLA